MLEKIKDKFIQGIEEHKEKKIKKIEEEKNMDIEEKINMKNTIWGDRLDEWFNKIDFLELEQEDKAEVAQKVKIQAKADKLYWIEIFLSGIIASLGLLQNSVAVIIGAMLIAPFLRPINGIAFGIARGEKKIFFNSLKVFFISSFVSILMGFLVINLTGLYRETTEILTRTSPNIIDLFIAVFSAMVAVLSLRYKRLGESVAGVAMAASLMPPLGVIGMEIALGNYSLAGGAAMLFIANIVAIIFVGIGAFWLYGFTPNDGSKQKKSFIRISLIIFIIGLISVPLIQNLIYIKEKNIITYKLENNVYSILKNKVDNFTIFENKIIKLDKENVEINLTLNIIEGTKFYKNFKRYLENELSIKLERKVKIYLKLNLIAKALSKEEEEKQKLNLIKRKKILEKENILRQENYINILKNDFELDFNKKLEEEISVKLKKEIEKKLKKEFDELLEEKIQKLYKDGVCETQKK